ncbi:putative sulfate exporter family transporter [Lacticaseibacillus mingshuiensis]|uniref:Sulfate exporter family transporter n=1 Tax=Lacticaseibacillus mingshuiensis TaxID=2799574 RepID=A0ABW4CEJ1_9LACO|nr:putative sulfate exporter family transporter [Lacticaseibacillus mingshuiensis]
MTLFWSARARAAETPSRGPLCPSPNQSQPTAAAARPKQFLIPWYVLGFAAFCLLGSVIQLPKFVAADAHWLSGWLETTALAAIGLRLDLRAFLKEGKRIALFGGGTLVMQVALGALLVRLLVR